MTLTYSKIEKNSLVECEITALALGGRGVARIGGMVLFVERGLPGQHVLARVQRIKRRFAEAQIEQILKVSPNQVKAFCPHFGICGGCIFQDLAYSEQLRWKTQQVADSLTRIGGEKNVKIRPILASPQTRAYRNKMEYAFQGHGESLALGLKERSGHSVINVTQCDLQTPTAMVLLAATREFCRNSKIPAWDGKNKGFWRHLIVRTTANQDIVAHCITTHDPRQFKAVQDLGHALKTVTPKLIGFTHSTTSQRTALATGEKGILVLGKDHFIENMGRLALKISISAFFQTNTLAAALLCNEVLEITQLTGIEVVYDLYCGVGGLTLTLAPKAAKIYGLELSEAAVVDARDNARYNGLTNCEFLAGHVNLNLVSGLPRPEIIICNPPRTGLDNAALSLLQKLSPAKVLAISCDPATLARDVARLNTLYKLTTVQPIDMFPHTAHVETMVLLQHRS